MVARFLADGALADVTAAWARDYRVLAPVREGAAVVYRPWAADMHPFLGRMPSSSANFAAGMILPRAIPAMSGMIASTSEIPWSRKNC